MTQSTREALAWAHALREAVAIHELEHPGSIVFGNAKPDPEHPGRVLAARPGLAKWMKGGHVMCGEWDCDECSRPFYMEVAINAKGDPIDSVGGVLFPDVALCDRCSPI